MYRDEVVARKRAHNALEDAKGKIRVYARVRPLLDFEAAKKQVRRLYVCLRVYSGAAGHMLGTSRAATPAHPQPVPPTRPRVPRRLRWSCRTS